MKVGFYQFWPLFGSQEQNCNKIIAALREVETDIIVLPELSLSGYHFKDKQEAIRYAEDPQNSRYMDSIAELAHKKNFHVVIGFAEKSGDQCFNSAALISPNGIEHIYRKIHLFHEEKLYFDPGDIALSVHDIGGVKIGMMICFDWVFPEVTRTLSMCGAQVICQPANLVLDLCQQAMLVRCIENGVFAITANRYGADKRPHGALKFTGKSQIVGPSGERLHSAASQCDTLTIIDIDPDEANSKMITPRNHLLDDRRPEFYSLSTGKRQAK